MDDLIENGAITSSIAIVGVFNTPKRLSEYTYSQDPQFSEYPALADEYLDFLEDVLRPDVVNHVRVSEDVSWGILGSSLGGLVSCYAGWTRSSYDVAGCMSSSFWWNEEDFNAKILGNGTSALPEGQHTTFYLDSGTGIPGQSDDDEFETIRVYKSLEALGKVPGSSLRYALDKGGQHNEKSWGDRFWKPMTDFYSPRPGI